MKSILTYRRCSFCPGENGQCGVQLRLRYLFDLFERYANWSGSMVSGMMVLM